jgi:putative heme-binding domain-containing protein
MKKYTELAEADASPPDLALGRAVFVKACHQCHTLYGAGGNVGPDLTGSNRANLDYLLSNVLDPSAVLAKEYQPTVVYTDDGRVITGIVKAEDAASITLQLQNETVVVPKGEIEESQRSDKSMMPDDLLKQFDDHQVRSLIAYMATRRQTPLLATAENAAGFFNGKDLTGWRGDESLWKVENGEIVGTSPGLDHNTFLISELVVEDFTLSFDVKLEPNEGNSGVQFRSAALEDGEMKGYQADIGAGWWGKLYEENGRALLWDKSGEEHVKPGDWNHYEIIAEGHHIRTLINGQPCVDLQDEAGALRGVIGLQIHSGGPMTVRFKNLKLTAPGAIGEATVAKE